jgi:hypothetical protein
MMWGEELRRLCRGRYTVEGAVCGPWEQSGCIAVQGKAGCARLHVDGEGRWHCSLTSARKWLVVFDVIVIFEEMASGVKSPLKSGGFQMFRLYKSLSWNLSNVFLVCIFSVSLHPWSDGGSWHTFIYFFLSWLFAPCCVYYVRFRVSI